MCKLKTCFFQSPPFRYSGAILALFIMLLFFMPLIMFFVYIVSFIFNKFETAQGVMPHILSWVFHVLFLFVVSEMISNF